MSNNLKNKIIIISEGLLFLFALFFVVSNNLSLSVALGIIILSILIPLFIIFPNYSLLLLIIVRNSTDAYSENIFINIFDIVSLNFSSILGIMIILWVLYVIIKERINIRKIPLTIPWVLFLGVSLLSVIYSLDKVSTLKIATKLFDFYFLYIISYFYFKQAVEQGNKKFRKYFIIAILISFIIPFVFGIYQIIFQRGYVGPEGLSRIYGTFTHPNIFAFTLLLLFFILIILYHNVKDQSKKAKESNLYLFLIFTTVFLLLNTFTRSAWIGALIYIISYLIIYKKNKIFNILYYICAIAFLCFVVITYTPLKYYDFNNINFIRRITTSDTYISSTEWRTNSWKQMSSYVYESPVIGFGLDTYRLLREKQVASVYEDPYYAHNDYLQILIELGIIGLVLYLNLIFQTFYRIYKKYLLTKNKTILLSLIGIILIFGIGLVDNILMSTSLQWIMWAYIGFLLV